MEYRTWNIEHGTLNFFKMDFVRPNKQINVELKKVFLRSTPQNAFEPNNFNILMISLIVPNTGELSRLYRMEKKILHAQEYGPTNENCPNY